MPSKKKTAKEKLHVDRQPEIADIPERMQKQLGPGKMLIPTPVQVDQMISEIPEGYVARIGDLRSELAKRAGADVTCPLCSGIFWRLSAEAAEEDRRDGAADVSPWWRVVRDNGALNEKLPGGVEGHAVLLESEGHTVQKGKVAVEAPNVHAWQRPGYTAGAAQP